MMTMMMPGSRATDERILVCICNSPYVPAPAGEWGKKKKEKEKKTRANQLKQQGSQAVSVVL